MVHVDLASAVCDIPSLTSALPRELGGEITRDGDFQVFEGCHFRNGFMYKNFVMAAIVSVHSQTERKSALFILRYL